MRLHYQKYSPTGNITLLVTTPVPRSGQAPLAQQLLARLGGEQVGFIEPPADPRCAARLQMMGGEFCGNATMSLGAMLARERALPEGGSLDLLLEVSGAGDPVPCRIRREGDAWIGTVQMPLPTAIGDMTLQADAGPMTVPMVAFPGIAHLILPRHAAPDEARLRRRLPEWNARIGADALGALLWDEEARAIDPLVYVPSAGTLVREHGCGSGSAAAGSWLALREGRAVEVPIAQSGGVITVNAVPAGGMIASLAITGRVALLEEGMAEL